MEANIQKILLDIRDLENEIQTTKDYVAELSNSLSRQNIRLLQLQGRLQEKNNMMTSLHLVVEDRKERLSNENTWKSRIIYGHACQKYLELNSNHNYPFVDMILEEVIEFAHKLHFLHCVKEWMIDCNLEMSHELPSSEFDFDLFESKNIVDDDYIRIYSESSLMNYTIPLKVWYSLFEMENECSFTIESQPSIMEKIVKQSVSL